MRQDMEAKSPQTMKLVYYRCKMIRNTYINMFLWIFNFMYDFKFVLDCGSTAQTNSHHMSVGENRLTSLCFLQFGSFIIF